ncbi:MAG: hypothetical protein KIS83_01035 [Rubrivivax sp.]|nr:hypothetical protein [Rubrivivax sp.]
MHPAALSIKVFGVYVALTGLGLLVAPGLTLAPLGVAAPTEVWIRVVGALAIVIGYYYWACGAAGAVDFFRATVRGRPLFAALCVLLIVAFQAPLQLLLFAAVDLAGAAWTWQGLRAAARG